MTTHRILIYGASNLWLSRRAALTELRRRFPGYLEIGVASGPGRSYGLRAGNPLVRYEPLKFVDFGFTGEVSGEKIALLTDIGNDLAYSQKPATILKWVFELAQKLQDQGYRVIFGGVPLRSLSTIDARFFQRLAKLYYPSGSVTKELITRDLKEVDIGIRELCRERDLLHVELAPEWYSFDRFHLKTKARFVYWEHLLQEYPVKLNYDSFWSLAARQPLFPREYWFLGQPRRGRERYLNLVPESLTLVR